MNACLADALIYVGDQGHSIKRQIRKDVEQALVDEDATKQNAVLLVSESLGSKVMFDILSDIMQDAATFTADAKLQLLKTRQLMMFANQIPILDLSGPESAALERFRRAGGVREPLQGAQELPRHEGRHGQISVRRAGRHAMSARRSSADRPVPVPQFRSVPKSKDPRESSLWAVPAAPAIRSSLER